MTADDGQDFRYFTMDLPIITHVGLNCSDPVATERFYTRYFGFARDRILFPGEQQIVFLRSGEFCLELFRAEGNFPAPPPVKDGPTYTGFRHLAFRVADLDAALREIGTDTEITLGPLDLSEQGLSGRIVWLRDPDGRIVELCE